jgi:hypothetical protein
MYRGIVDRGALEVMRDHDGGEEAWVLFALLAYGIDLVTMDLEALLGHDRDGVHASAAGKSRENESRGAECGR